MAVVEAEVTFLSTEEGGGSTALLGADRVSTEEYLGVQFRRVALVLAPGSSATVWMDLVYYPASTYERLLPGATFTIREGVQVVGYGKVLRRNDDRAI